MKLPETTLGKKIWQFCQEYTQQYQQKYQHLPVIENDDDWPSPCLSNAHDDNHSYWSPVVIDEDLSFSNVEEALSLKFHQDIKTYFTSVYCESIDAKCTHGELSLLFAWSAKDFERLQQNIIGHILMKRKLKQAETVFFALTDDENYILSVINETGEVWVERVGCEPEKKIADSIADFIGELTPSFARLTK